jgi:hypothetical protein
MTRPLKKIVKKDPCKSCNKTGFGLVLLDYVDPKSRECLEGRLRHLQRELDDLHYAYSELDSLGDFDTVGDWDHRVDELETEISQLDERLNCLD